MSILQLIIKQIYIYFKINNIFKKKHILLFNKMLFKKWKQFY